MTWLDLDLGQGVTVGMVLVAACIVLAFAAGAWFRGKRTRPTWKPPED